MIVKMTMGGLPDSVAPGAPLGATRASSGPVFNSLVQDELASLAQSPQALPRSGVEGDTVSRLSEQAYG